MTYCLSHCVLPVSDLEKAHDFYVQVLGCVLEKSWPHQLELSNGLNRIWLEYTDRDYAPVSLMFEVEKLTQASQILQNAGAMRLQQYQEEDVHYEVLQDPCGHWVRLWHCLSEDERDTPPPLVKSKEWHLHAESLLQNLLKSVPEAFRPGGRKVAVIEAEYVAEQIVEPSHAIIGWIRSAPAFKREILKNTLFQHGIDWIEYQAEFELDCEDSV